MKRTRQNPHAMGPVHRGAAIRRIRVLRTAARRAAARGTLWVLGPLAVAVPITPVLALAGAGADWIAAAWLAAVLWTIAASFLQALRQGWRHGDGPVFQSVECPPSQDDFDFFTKSGAYLDLRIRADHEALMRDGDRFLADHDHLNSPP